MLGRLKEGPETFRPDETEYSGMSEAEAREAAEEFGEDFGDDSEEDRDSPRADM